MSRMLRKKIALFFIFLLSIVLLIYSFKEKLFPSQYLNPLKEGVEQRIPEQKEKRFDISWDRWEDPAGFAFEYPSEATIDAHLEDKVNYAKLEITKPGEKGRIMVICDDSQFLDIEDWMKKDDLVKAGSSLETEIASMSAKRVALGEGREVAGFIDWDQVIYTIDLQPEEEVDYWRKVYNHLLDSFELIPLEGETQAQFKDWLEGFDVSGVDIVEPVEIIQ